MNLTQVVKIEKKEPSFGPHTVVEVPVSTHKVASVYNSGFNECVDELSKWEMDEERLVEVLKSLNTDRKVKGKLKVLRISGNPLEGEVVMQLSEESTRYTAKSILSRSSEWILRKEKE